MCSLKKVVEISKAHKAYKFIQCRLTLFNMWLAGPRYAKKLAKYLVFYSIQNCPAIKKLAKYLKRRFPHLANWVINKLFTQPLSTYNHTNAPALILSASAQYVYEQLEARLIYHKKKNR